MKGRWADELFYDIGALAWQKWEKLLKASDSAAGRPAKTRTKYLLHRNLEHSIFIGLFCLHVRTKTIIYIINSGEDVQNAFTVTYFAHHDLLNTLSRRNMCMTTTFPTKSHLTKELPVAKFETWWRTLHTLQLYSTVQAAWILGQTEYIFLSTRFTSQKNNINIFTVSTWGLIKDNDSSEHKTNLCHLKLHSPGNTQYWPSLCDFNPDVGTYIFMRSNPECLILQFLS